MPYDILHASWIYLVRASYLFFIWSFMAQSCWAGQFTLPHFSCAWSISTKKCCRTQWGSNPWPPDHQLDAHPTEPPRQVICVVYVSFNIATDKALFSSEKCWYLSYFSMKTCCGYSLEAPQRGTSNEYPQHIFLWRNKKNITWIPLLSVAMFQHCHIKKCYNGRLCAMNCLTAKSWLFFSSSRLKPKAWWPKVRRAEGLAPIFVLYLPSWLVWSLMAKSTLLRSCWWWQWGVQV